jgi:hypothetical protein
MDIQAMEDGVIIGAGSIQGQGPQTYFKLNEDGEELWSFNIDLFSYDISIPREIIVEEDGIVVACEYSWDGLFYRLPLILKTDYSGNHLWAVPLSGSDTQFQSCEHIVKSPDGGYLAAAWQYEENPPDPELNGNFNWNAWLIKVSQEGVLEWERFYHFVESTNDKHRVYDLKATSDGGYIFCGDAIDEDVETNGQVIQQGWLVKVDGCGCLVPGCDVDCTVSTHNDKAEQKKYFIFGPNPVSQYLNIYFFEAQQDAKLVVYDMTGKQLDSFVPRTGNTTYMLDVEHYAAGTYVLSLQEDGRVMQSERIVVE